jgi:hypothetical protein
VNDPNRKSSGHIWCEFLYLFTLWRDRYQARQEIKDSERRARLAELWAERDRCFEQRASLPPEQHAAVTERIAALGRAIAELNAPSLSASAASWG